MNSEFFTTEFLGNTVRQYFITVFTILMGLVLMRLFSKILAKVLYRAMKKHASGATADELFNLLAKPVSAFFVLVITYIAIRNLEAPPQWNLNPVTEFGLLMVLHKLFLVILIITIGGIILRFIDFIALIFAKRAELTETKTDDQLVPFLRDTLKLVALVLLFFFMLGLVFQVNIAAIIGGLGIGGLALALAGKETIENLFGSITIFLDKPFTVGDVIKIEGLHGTVEKIGLRSTRVRTLEKSLVAVPNKKMINADVENITERTYWRARFNIGVLYDTKPEDLQNIIAEIKQYLDYHEDISPDTTVVFEKFNDSSLDILVTFLVKTNEFDKFAAVREQVNFRIIEVVLRNNTSFAFPTRTVILEKESLH